MRRPFALLALFVMTWSNATALSCAPPPSAEGGAAETPMHAHHAPGAGDASENHPPDSRSEAPDCGILMACGAAAKGSGGQPALSLLTRLDDAPVAAFIEPAATVPGLDTPPPREHA